MQRAVPECFLQSSVQRRAALPDRGGGLLPEMAEIDEAVAIEIDRRVKARLELLKAKNFAEADTIRDTLLAEGVQLKDGKDAATGERLTTWELKR